MGSDPKQTIDASILPGGDGSIVIHKTITVDHRTYRDLDEMPPDVRRLFEHRIEGGGAPASDPGKSGLSLSFHVGGGNVGPSPGTTIVPGEGARPIQPARDQARRFLSSLVFWVVVALILWTLLGR